MDDIKVFLISFIEKYKEALELLEEAVGDIELLACAVSTEVQKQSEVDGDHGGENIE